MVIEITECPLETTTFLFGTITSSVNLLQLSQSRSFVLSPLVATKLDTQRRAERGLVILKDPSIPRFT